MKLKQAVCFKLLNSEAEPIISNDKYKYKYIFTPVWGLALGSFVKIRNLVKIRCGVAEAGHACQAKRGICEPGGQAKGEG